MSGAQMAAGGSHDRRIAIIHGLAYLPNDLPELKVDPIDSSDSMPLGVGEGAPGLAAEASAMVHAPGFRLRICRSCANGSSPQAHDKNRFRFPPPRPLSPTQFGIGLGGTPHYLSSPTTAATLKRETFERLQCLLLKPAPGEHPRPGGIDQLFDDNLALLFGHLARSRRS